MAMDTSLFVNIVSQLKDKGIKDTDKGLKGLSGRTNTLTRQMGILARRLITFEALRRSFKAFVEDEAGARRLNTTLNNLGLSFSALAADKYIANLEKTANVIDDELRPAFENIARVTGNFGETQEILNTALDVAAGTGQSVVAVSKALARAYSGNTTSLSRLNAGLTKADLATGNFVLIQEKLNTLFTGQNATLIDTYEGKINALKIAFGNAGEAIGKGMVDSLEQLGSNDIQNTLDFIVKAGETIGKIFGFAAKQIAFIKEIFTRDDFFSAESQLELFEKFNKLTDPARGRAAARERRQAFIQEQKTAERIAKLRAKAAAEEKARLAASKKADADKKTLSNAEKLFDDQRISLEAALQNERLSENELLRVQLKKAILNENADRAAILAAKLKESQAELLKLESFKPANPFSAWVTSLEELDRKLKLLASQNAGTVGGGGAGGPELIPSLASGDLRELTATEQNIFNVQLTVEGSVITQQDLEKVIVDTVVKASTDGYSTGWYRTTGLLSAI
jgi:hypothetical protein